jgi:hypothetical protein
MSCQEVSGLHWIRLAFAGFDLVDRYAYQVAGSTNCALIYCINNINKCFKYLCLMYDD